MSVRPLRVCKTLEGSLQNDCKLEKYKKAGTRANAHTCTAREANEQIIKGKENKSDKQVF